MPKIIVKCSYLKGARHRSFYTKYMATREGAEKVNASYGKADATAKQKTMINQILKDFPDTKKLFEYEDYIKEPNRENASELISSVMEHNLETVATKENYVDYIANRPRAEKLGEHGLFSDTDDPIDLNEAAKRVADHDGIVWTNIISIRREDAVRLGYDNAKAWINMCRAKRNELAEAMQIDSDKLRWYAAFHNEGHHPHIHMIVYSDDGKQGYLTKKGIEQLRSMYAGTIFKQELYHLYENKSKQRDEVKRVSRERIEELIASLNQPIQDNEQICAKLMVLYESIQNHNGRLVYGYLKKEDKKIVDDIVCLLEKDERIQELYDVWYQTKEDISLVYKDDADVKIPLHMQKEFKSIRNIILQEVANLNMNAYASDEFEFCDTSEEDTTESIQMEKLSLIYSREEGKNVEKAIDYLDRYSKKKNENAELLLAKIWLKENYFEHFEEARAMLEELAEKENESALLLLGIEYATGEHFEKDKEKAIYYFKQCSEKGNQFADYQLYKIYQEEPMDITNMLYYLDKCAKQENATAQFQMGKIYLEGRYVEKNKDSALNYLKKSARQNNMFAQYLLGKLFLYGKEVPKDEELAIQYLEASASQGNVYARWLLEHKDEYWKQPLVLLVSRFFHHLSRTFERQLLPSTNNPLFNIDHKLRKKLQMKRTALGHKENDHTMNQER